MRIVLIALLLVLTAGCKMKPGEGSGPPPSSPVDLSAAGQKFDPPIKPEELPEGAFYCDMGTVHWAASAQPKGNKCPECGMKLKTYAAKAEKKKDDHGHGHDHPHDDHQH